MALTVEPFVRDAQRIILQFCSVNSEILFLSRLLGSPLLSIPILIASIDSIILMSSSPLSSNRIIALGYCCLRSSAVLMMVFDFPWLDLPLLTIMVFIFKYLNLVSLIISCFIMSYNQASYLSGIVQVLHF